MGLSNPAGAVNTVGNQQTSAVTGQTVTPAGQTVLDATYNANPVNPAYWENQGFQTTQNFGTGSQSTLAGFNIGNGQASAGGAVYTNPTTGEVVFVDQNGTVQQRFTKDQWAAEVAKNQNGVTSAGEAVPTINGLAHQVNDDASSINVVGHPGISDDTANKINDTVIDTATGTGDHNVTVDPTTGTVSVGGNPLGGLTGGTSQGEIMSPIQAAIARQNAVADQMGSAYGNFTPTGAPVAATPAQIQAAYAAQLDPIQAAIARSQDAQAAQIGQTTLTPQQQAIQAQQIAAAHIAPNQQAQVAQVAPTQIGPTSLANTAQVDTANQAQLRAAQMGLIGGLQNAIAGKEASPAEIMLRNATDRNVANQYAMAQAANGMNTGFAQRSAMINAADMNSNAVMQQALLRAQELQANRGQLAGVLDTTRGADIGLATNQAGLQQQTNLANTGALNTANLTQAQIAAAQATANAQLQQGASQFNAGQANDLNTTQAQLQQAASLANQQAGLQAGTTNATLAQQVALANSGALNTTNQTNAQLQQAASLQNAQLGTQASLANANNITNANTSSAQLANAVNLANANNQTQANTTTGQLQAQTNIANANNAVSTNALNQKAQQDLAANQLAATGQAGQTAVGGGNVQAELAKAEAAKQAAEIGGVASAGAALLSDRREKTDIVKAEAEIAEFASKLSPYAFRYKAPGRPGAAPGKRYGIMAQDLEKSAVGRSLVREDDDGTKTIDVPQSIGAILATLSAMNKRIEAR